MRIKSTSMTGVILHQTTRHRFNMMIHIPSAVLMCFAEERIFPMKPEVNWKQVQVVAFDLFGTVFKLDRPKEEIQAYAEHIAKPEWSPLVLPDEWGKLEMFEDAKQG